ncbi:hypothetical protein [Novosphingobium sp. P6W]|nr:hypothetical protein [Novosphingobium sp. P6W]
MYDKPSTGHWAGLGAAFLIGQGGHQGHGVSKLLILAKGLSAN